MGASAVPPSCLRCPENRHLEGQGAEEELRLLSSEEKSSPKLPCPHCPLGLLPTTPSPSLQAASVRIQHSFYIHSTCIQYLLCAKR